MEAVVVDLVTEDGGAAVAAGFVELATDETVVAAGVVAETDGDGADEDLSCCCCDNAVGAVAVVGIEAVVALFCNGDAW